MASLLISPAVMKALTAASKDLFNPPPPVREAADRCMRELKADPDYQRLLQQMADENEPHPFCRTEL